MVVVKVCVGSSCHLKNAPQIVELLKQNIEKYKLDDKVELMGSFCAGKCNRDGVTITVNDDVFTGVTVESFENFFKDKILKLTEFGE